MQDRDQIFRERLIAVISELNGGTGKDANLRRMVGSFARRLFEEAKVPSWGVLKRRADPPTYDSMLKLFTVQSESAAKRNDKTTLRAFDILALSLVGRNQQQADLEAGLTFLDKYIDRCVAFTKRRTVARVTTRPPAR